ncbi:MAG TPA: hypothetical protein VMW51_08025 [Terriglobia bacterium]|nr:hypothetical protein [Terriglobia bacterium]HVB29680.1 hypothetical protein [Terriglobia bacterium]
MAMESTVVNIGPAFIEAVKERRTALVCAVAVAVMAIGVFHAPAEPVLLGCGGAVTMLVFWGCLKRVLQK